MTTTKEPTAPRKKRKSAEVLPIQPTIQQRSPEKREDSKLGYDVWNDPQKKAAYTEMTECTDTKAKKEMANGEPIKIYPHSGWRERKKLVETLSETAFDIVYGLALRGANKERIARFFGVPVGYIKENFSECIDIAAAELEIKLIDTQMYIALERRNPMMLIWLSKNYLGFTDKAVEKTVTDSNGAVFEVKLVQATIEREETFEAGAA